MKIQGQITLQRGRINNNQMFSGLGTKPSHRLYRNLEGQVSLDLGSDAIYDNTVAYWLSVCEARYF